MSDAGKWGPYPPYETACAKLLAHLSEGLPLPHFWMLEENEQKVTVAVIEHTAMSLEKWDRLTPPERVVGVDKANEVVAKLRVTEELPSQEATVKDVKPSTNPAKATSSWRARR